MFETMAPETPNFFSSLLFAAVRLLPFGKAMLSGTVCKGYLSASLKSTCRFYWPTYDFGHDITIYIQDWSLMSPHQSSFTVLPVYVNSFRLFLFIGLWNDVTPLTRRSCIKQFLNSIPICHIFRTWLLSSTGTPELMLYSCWESKSGVKGLRWSSFRLTLLISRNLIYQMDG